MDPKEKIIDELIQDISFIRNEHVKSLGIVLKLTEIATKNLTPLKFCEEIINVIINETEFDNASMLLYDEESDSLNLITASGNSSVMFVDEDEVKELDFNKKLSFSRDNTIAWKTFESQEPNFIEDVHKSDFFKKSDTMVQIGSLFCLPLGNKGVINLSNSSPTSLSSYQKRDLIIISQLIQKLISLNNFLDRLRSSHVLIQTLIEGKKLDIRQISQKDMDNFFGLESALLYAPQGIAIIEDNIITLVNPSLITLLNEKSNIVGMDISYTCLSHIYHSLRNEDESNIINQKEFQLNIHPDKIVFVEAFLHSLLYSSGKNQKKSFLLFLHDITHQKEITKRLIELEKKEIFSELSSGFAHHFNNILSIIIANIEMSLRDNDLSSIKNRLKKIIEPISYAQNLVRNIQIISAPNSQDFYTDNYVSSIEEFIDEIISITSFKWMDEAQKSGKNVIFLKEINEIFPLKINPDHLRNVLINLIINSVDALDKDGLITIKVYKKDNDNGIIEVVDNGCGIDKDDIAKIFSPFYTTMGMKSSGLGLTVSREIITGYNGDLIIESHKDIGTTAKVILPFFKDHPIEKKSNIVSENNIHKDLVNILYVDDEEGIVDTISEMFELDGFRIISTSKSQKAIDIINEKNIDILVTDLGMPGINGWELAKSCREKNPASYIILATGWGNQIEDDYLSKGINYVLSKPYKYEQLKNIILSSGKF